MLLHHNLTDARDCVLKDRRGRCSLCNLDAEALSLDSMREGGKEGRKRGSAESSPLTVMSTHGTCTCGSTHTRRTFTQNEFSMLRHGLF